MSSRRVNITYPISSLEPFYPEVFGGSSASGGARSSDPESLEWPIKALKALVDHVENSSTGLWAIEAEMDNPEVLPDALMRGWVTRRDGFKIDLARTIPAPHSPRSTIGEIANSDFGLQEFPPTLSLYITALTCDTAGIMEDFTSDVFVGITTLSSNAGHRYGETAYLWKSMTQCEFSTNNDYCAVELPLLSELAEMEGIKEEDGFLLCIWTGQKQAQIQGFKLPDPILQATLKGLERLVDRDTGDIKFICLEHVIDASDLSETSDVDGDADLSPLANSKDDASATGLSLFPKVESSQPTGRPTVSSRKRVIYAHTDILEEKSEYFKSLLTSGFSESGRYKTIAVDYASFDTLYWVIRYLYINTITFSRDIPVRSTVLINQLDSSRKSRLLYRSARDEWEFHTLPFQGEAEEDLDQVESRMVRSVASSASGARSVRQVEVPKNAKSSAVEKTASSRTSPTVSGTTTRKETVVSPTSTASASLRRQRHAGPGKASSASGVSSPTLSAKAKGASSQHHGAASNHTVALKARPATPLGSPSPSSTRTLPTVTSPPLSPRKTKSPTTSAVISRGAAGAAGIASSALDTRPPFAIRHDPIMSDPHPHPAGQPALPSALDVYVLADRYMLDDLRDMAKQHLMEWMDEEGCMPMAFASYRYDSLHNEVLDYIMNNWASVKLTSTFPRYIEEVSEGVWGDCGPAVLNNIFQRL